MYSANSKMMEWFFQHFHKVFPYLLADVENYGAVKLISGRAHKTECFICLQT